MKRNGRNSSGIRAVLLGTVMFGAAAGVAGAQDNGGDRAITLEEIVVTARRASERLMDVPVNVTALTSETMAKLGVKNLVDLMQTTPSLSYGNTGQRTGNRLTMRGLGISTTGTGKASVFLDGVYIAGDYTGLSLAGLERVEVLKGPQSALFGRTSFAGAINYVTKQPADEMSGSVTVDVATMNSVRVDGFVSGPVIADKLYGFLSVSSYDFEGPKAWTDVGDASRHGSQNSRGAVAKLTWTPTEPLKITALASYNRNDDGPSSALFVDPASRNGVVNKTNPLTGAAAGTARYPFGTTPTRQPQYGDYDFFHGYLTDVGDRIRQWRTYVQAEYEFDDGHTLTVTGAQNDQFLDSQSNANLRDRSPASIGGFVFNSYFYNALDDDSVEVRLASPQGQWFRYAVGAYWLDIRQDNRPNKIYYAAPNPANDLVAVGAYGLNRNTDRSVFGALYIDPLDHLTLSFEGRYQEEAVKRTGFNAGTILVTNYNNGATSTLTPILAPDGSIFSTTFTSFLPRVNAMYKVSPDINVYATYSKGNNPGSFNTSLYATEEQRYIKEENLYNYELGVKARLWNQLSIDFSAYHMDWKNQQTTGTFYSGALIYSIIQNTGKSTVDGAEVEMNWQTPIEGLSLRGTASYNDGQYKNYCSANYAALIYAVPSTATPAQRLQYACAPVDGNSLESISKWQTSLSFQYETPLDAVWTAYVGGDYQYMSRQWDSELNFARTPRADIFNARVGFDSSSWSLELYGRNLSKEDSPIRVTRASDTMGGATNATNQSIAYAPRIPRQYGLKASVKF